MAGEVDKVKGVAKEVVGKAVGNRRLEREGKRDQIVGDAKDAVHDLKKKVQKKIDKVIP